MATYYDEWYDLMKMNPQFYYQNTGAGANTWHGGALWRRPNNQSNAGGFLSHPLVSPTNLGTAQESPYMDRIRQANLPAPENKRSGLLTSSSDLGGLIGDNKMAAALIALRGLQAGSRGQNIFQAAPDAVMGGLADSSLIEKYKDLKGVTEAKKKIQKSKKFTDKEKLMIAANIKLPTSTNTAAMKNFTWFKNMKKSPENIAIADMIFKNKTKSDFLSQIMVAQAKDEGKSQEEKNKELKEFEENWDKINNQITSEIETTTAEGLPIPTNKSDLVDGKKYNVQGVDLIWYEEENQFR